MGQLVLIVEPDQLLATSASKYLQSKGYKVQIATNMRRAIDLADDNPPDVAVLELQLARHNGIEFLYEFRSYADWQVVPVIIYSQVPPAKFKLMQKQLKLLGINRHLDKARAGLADLARAIASELAQ